MLHTSQLWGSLIAANCGCWLAVGLQLFLTQHASKFPKLTEALPKSTEANSKQAVEPVLLLLALLLPPLIAAFDQNGNVQTVLPSIPRVATVAVHCSSHAGMAQLDPAHKQQPLELPMPPFLAPWTGQKLVPFAAIPLGHQWKQQQWLLETGRPLATASQCPVAS